MQAEAYGWYTFMAGTLSKVLTAKHGAEQPSPDPDIKGFPGLCLVVDPLHLPASAWADILEVTVKAWAARSEGCQLPLQVGKHQFLTPPPGLVVQVGRVNARGRAIQRGPYLHTY